MRLPRGRVHTLQLAGAARGHTRVTLGPGRRESRPFPSLEGRGAAVPVGKATAWEGHRRDSSVEESCAAKTFPETAPPSRARGQLRARDPSTRPPQPNDTHETEGRGCKTPRVLRGGDALVFL